MTRGKVYLVGAGPGDPGLITVRGLEVIRQADVVIYDRLVHPDLVEQAPAHAVRIYVGKEAGLHCVPQSQINDLLRVYAQRGALVVRLKGGDPFVFGRGGEEAEALAGAGIAFEIVPGVSSVVAVPAYAGIPLTHRTLSSSFAVVTGHEENGKRTSAVDWETLATAVDTLVVLMGVKNLRQIVTQLLLRGRSPETPVALIRWGTTAHQQTIIGTLANIADKAEEAALESPVVTVVGEVVRLRDHLQWFAELQEETERASGRRGEQATLDQQIGRLGDRVIGRKKNERETGRSGDRENKHQGPNPPISHSPDLPF